MERERYDELGIHGGEGRRIRYRKGRRSLNDGGVDLKQRGTYVCNVQEEVRRQGSSPSTKGGGSPSGKPEQGGTAPMKRTTIYPWR
jgi:hypothetical protein